MRNFLFTLMIIAAVFTVAAQTDQTSQSTSSQKVTWFDYTSPQFDYSYTEKGQQKTAHLTDAARSTDQIIALLKKVYTDPNIPGIRYAYDYTDRKGRLMDYNYNFQPNSQGGGGTDQNTWPRTEGEVIKNPNQDGMTMLLVQVKESYDGPFGLSQGAPREVIEKAYQSVQVVTDFTRVHDASNPGYLFSIDGTATNRFFFISKGKPRGCSQRPLYRLFEQISPVKPNSSGATYDFIQAMRGGQQYYCYHDCTDVVTITDNHMDGKGGHWFTISGAGEAYSLDNLALYVPDRRFHGDLRPENADGNFYDDRGEYYTNYGNSDHSGKEEWDIMPKVLMYTADLEAVARPAAKSGYFNITLNWGTSFTHDKLGADVPEHFYVYLFNPNTAERTLIQDVEKDENGMVRVKTHSYLVEQTDQPQSFSYLITAQPINYEADGTTVHRNADGTPLITITATSPVRTVVIPPLGMAFFTQAVEFRSFYDVNDEDNYYRNTLIIHPSTKEDFDKIHDYTGHYNITRTDTKGNKVTVAHLKFTPLGTGMTGYNYQVTYAGDDPNVTGLSEQETRYIGLFGGTEESQNPVRTGTIESFDQSAVTIVDRFKVSTKINDHESEYTYLFELDAQENSDADVTVISNSLHVPVYKTTNEVNGSQFTLDEVLCDNNRGLGASPASEITYTAQYDPAANLIEYDVFRLDKDITPIEEFKVSKAEHFNNSGEYHVYIADTTPKMELNVLLDDYPKIEIGKTGLISVADNNALVGLKPNLYVPMILTLYGGNQQKPNTYGCDIQRMAYPDVELHAFDLLKTNPFEKSDVDGMFMGFAVDLALEPLMPQDIKNVFYYRVWRVLDDDTETMLSKETLLNTLDDRQGTHDGQDDAYYSSIKSTYPKHVEQNGMKYVQLRDFFVDKAVPEGQSKNVTYVVRLYATNVDQDGEAQQIDGPKKENASGKDYFLAEKRVTVNFTGEGVITGLSLMPGDVQVATVTYYNLMGVPSSKPYSGMNIMVTRYEDGTTTTQKVLR
ncbi:MAG: hypothetical protein IKX39_00485 [Muribaculaceae bacterium]|nr:hypothetical protein [Muribaculaceae bacterium]